MKYHWDKTGNFVRSDELPVGEYRSFVRRVNSPRLSDTCMHL